NELVCTEKFRHTLLFTGFNIPHIPIEILYTSMTKLFEKSKIQPLQSVDFKQKSYPQKVSKDRTHT
ncbi:MAG: hypothetical protein L0G07_12155, partial [Chryseobacterium sp.]|nr:hypothetical protein [Chryseobacterium sp.]